MEVSSVGSAAPKLQQQLALAKSAQQDYADQAAEQARSRQEASRTEAAPSNAETTRSAAVRARERTEVAQQAQQQKVFVNAQGQKTGSIINVAA